MRQGIKQRPDITAGFVAKSSCHFADDQRRGNAHMHFKNVHAETFPLRPLPAFDKAHARFRLPDETDSPSDTLE